MINDAVFEPIFTADTPVNMQLLIEISGGGYLTNTEIAQESFSLVETINDGTELKFGGCNASVFKIRVRSSVRNLAKKTITVKQYAFADFNKWIKVINNVPVVYDINDGTSVSLPEDYFLIGTYEVLTDRPTPDKHYRDITAYDKLYKVINEDVSLWYNSLFASYDSVTLKTLRENFLAYYNIEYEAFTGVNDTLELGKNLGDSNISGKDILVSICELNGCFGYITRENKFRCKVLSPTSVKQYDRYIQGAIDYDETIANEITEVAIANDKGSVRVGISGNSYLINSNPLLSGLSESLLNVIGERLLPVVSNASYRPFSVKTYGDPCVELGDYITIPTSDTTVYSYVLNRELTGTQAMRDKIDAKGEGQNAAGVTGISSAINNIKNNLGDTIDYIYFINVATYALESDWSRLATLRIAVLDTQLVQLHGVVKVTLTNPGIIYVRYKVNGEYNPFIHVCQFPIGENTITLFIPITAESGIVNNIQVELMAGDAQGTVEAKDAQIVIQGRNVVKIDWDGNLDVEEEYSIIFGGGIYSVCDHTESITFDYDTPIPITASDTYVTDIDGGYSVDYTDDADVVTKTNEYSMVCEEDGNYDMIFEQDDANTAMYYEQGQE